MMSLRSTITPAVTRPWVGRGRRPRYAGGLALLAWFGLAIPAACGSKDAASTPRDKRGVESQPSQTDTAVGYDLRRLRPRNDKPLSTMFEELRAQAVAEGKTVAVLFSADWCESCRSIDLELGNRHPPEAIAHVRVFELKEEDWEAVTRMDEFSALRARWYPEANVYPVFVVLDPAGDKAEEMKGAIERLQAAGQEPTVSNWFRGLRG